MIQLHPRLITRTEKDIERAIFAPDLDREFDRARRRKWSRDRMTGLYVPHDQRHSGLTGTYTEVIYSNPLPGTAKNTFTTEFMINDTAGMGAAASIPAWFFMPSNNRGKALRIVARGNQLGTASTPPTWTLTMRLNPVVTPAVPPTGPIIGITPAITGTTTTNTLWEAELDVQLTVDGAAGNNSTLRGLGMWWSPQGFVSPFMGPLTGGAINSVGTVATFDISLLNTLTVGMTCGTSLAANQMQLLQLLVLGLN